MRVRPRVWIGLRLLLAAVAAIKCSEIDVARALDVIAFLAIHATILSVLTL